MTMTVCVYTGEWHSSDYKILEPRPSDNYMLGGFEAWRKELWGSDVIRSLNLKLLPALSRGEWVHAEGKALDIFESDVRTVQANAKLITQHVQIDEYSIMATTNRYLEAIARARSVDGGVVIW